MVIQLWGIVTFTLYFLFNLLYVDVYFAKVMLPFLLDAYVYSLSHEYFYSDPYDFL